MAWQVRGTSVGEKGLVRGSNWLVPDIGRANWTGPTQRDSPTLILTVPCLSMLVKVRVGLYVCVLLYVDVIE